MTDTNNQTSTPSKAPTHIAYQVRDREGKKGFWTRIGSAWAHGDGKGFNIQVEVVPLDGRITLRVVSEKKLMESTGRAQRARPSRPTNRPKELAMNHTIHDQSVLRPPRSARPPHRSEPAPAHYVSSRVPP